MEVKAGYKWTEVGIIPEDWEETTIEKTSIKVGSGITPTGGTKVYQSSGRPFVRSQNVGWGRLLLDDIAHINELTHATFPSTEIMLNDVLLNITGASIGRSAIADYRINGGNVNQHVCIIRVEPTKLNALFLNMYLLSQNGQKQIDSFQSGGNRQGLNFEQLKSFLIALPPLPEQHAIATALSDVDALLTALDTLIAKKRDIKQATMQQLLTGKTRLPGFSGAWEERKLGDIFEFLGSANNSRADCSEDGEIKYIHYGDIHMKNWNGFLDCASNDLPLIRKEYVARYPLLQDGDLLIADASEDEAGIGISVEVRNAKGRKVVAGLHTLLLRGNKGILVDGFKGYLQFFTEVKESIRKAATGISVYGISKSSIAEISILLPSLPEQNAIATVLSDMDAEIVALEQRRHKTAALKQGMMQELLTGRTRFL